METQEKLEENIETFYERNNMNIPEVEVRHYFNNDPYTNTEPNPNDSKVKKQLKLYKRFLVSQKIKEGQRGLPYYSTPDDVDARNARMHRNRVPLVEQQHMRRSELSADTRKNNSQPLREIFTNSDLRASQAQLGQEPEQIGLLQGYEEPSDVLAYPQIIPLGEMPEYDKYEPVQHDPKAMPVEEKKIPEPVVEASKNTAVAKPGPQRENFVIHQVKPDDTIGKLCLMYNVNKDVIRMANDFLGEEIYMYKELKIPYTYGQMYNSPNNGKTEEEMKREYAVDALNKILLENYKGKQESYAKEAKYYLEVNNYNLDDAIEEFEADLEFEKQVVKDNKIFDREQRRGRDKVGMFSCFG